MYSEFTAVLVLISAAHGLFISVLLLRKSRRYVFLAGVLLLLSFDLGSLYIYARRLEESYPFLYFTDVVTPFLYGPLLYWFARELSAPGFRARDLWHFLPAVLLWALVTPEIVDGLEDPQGIRELYRGLSAWDYGARLVLVLQLSIYGFARYRLPIPADPGARLGRGLQLGIFVLVWVTVLLESLAQLAFRSALEAIILGSVAGSIGLIYLVGYLSLVGRIPGPAPVKYAKTRLEDAELDRLVQRLRAAIRADDLYADPDLSLEEFARRLDIPAHRISQALNRGLDRNFFRFVNEYRVEAVKRGLVDEAFREQTVLEIALRCGFNSKASFNAVFKETTGMTPSAYRKQFGS